MPTQAQPWLRAELIAGPETTPGAQLMIPADAVEFHDDQLVFHHQGDIVYVAAQGQLRSITWFAKQPNPGTALRKAQWPNHGTRWTDEERQDLLRRIRAGDNWKAISHAHGRSRTGCQQEAVKQGWLDADTLRPKPEVLLGIDPEPTSPNATAPNAAPTNAASTDSADSAGSATAPTEASPADSATPNAAPATPLTDADLPDAKRADIAAPDDVTSATISADASTPSMALASAIPGGVTTTSAFTSPTPPAAIPPANTTSAQTDLAKTAASVSTIPAPIAMAGTGTGTPSTNTAPPDVFTSPAVPAGAVLADPTADIAASDVPTTARATPHSATSAISATSVVSALAGSTPGPSISESTSARHAVPKTLIRPNAPATPPPLAAVPTVTPGAPSTAPQAPTSASKSQPASEPLSAFSPQPSAPLPAAPAPADQLTSAMASPPPNRPRIPPRIPRQRTGTDPNPRPSAQADNASDPDGDPSPDSTPGSGPGSRFFSRAQSSLARATLSAYMNPSRGQSGAAPGAT